MSKMANKLAKKYLTGNAFNNKNEFERSYEEIIEKIEGIKQPPSNDMLVIKRNALLGYLPFELVKKYLIDTATKKQWGNFKPKDRQSILEEMKYYLNFAWEKANKFRGYSAARSMAHYTIWIWLVGDDLGNIEEYQYHGKDNLVKICEYYDWEDENLDDGVRENKDTEY